MTKEQEALCLNNMRLVSHCAKKFIPSGIPWDDLISCGNVGLVSAAVTYRPEKNTSFSTYAGRCIDNEVYKLLRQRKKHSKVTLSLDDEIAGADGLRLHDVLPDENDMAEAAERRLLAANAIARLQRFPERNRKVWSLYLGLAGEPPMNQKQVAKRMGCSRSLISRILKNDINKFRGEVL